MVSFWKKHLVFSLFPHYRNVLLSFPGNLSNGPSGPFLSVLLMCLTSSCPSVHMLLSGSLEPTPSIFARRSSSSVGKMLPYQENLSVSSHLASLLSENLCSHFLQEIEEFSSLDKMPVNQLLTATESTCL